LYAKRLAERMENIRNKTGGLKNRDMNRKENSKLFADPEMASLESEKRKGLITRAEKDQNIKTITASVNHRKNNDLWSAFLE